MAFQACLSGCNDIIGRFGKSLLEPVIFLNQILLCPLLVLDRNDTNGTVLVFRCLGIRVKMFDSQLVTCADPPLVRHVNGTTIDPFPVTMARVITLPRRPSTQTSCWSLIPSSLASSGFICAKPGSSASVASAGRSTRHGTTGIMPDFTNRGTESAGNSRRSDRPAAANPQR